MTSPARDHDPAAAAPAAPTADVGVEDRSRRVGKTGAVAAAARVTSVATSLAAVPLMLHAVGAYEFGVWMTITSGVALLSIADLGVGNSLLNALSTSRARNDQRALARDVSSAFYAFVVLAAVLLGGVIALAVSGSAETLFGLRSGGGRLGHDAAWTVLVTGACLLLSIPLSVADRVQLSHQQGWYSYAWQIVGQLVGFAGLCAAVLVGAELPVLALAVAAGPLLGIAGNAGLLFGRQMPHLRPRLKWAEPRRATRLARTGLLFLFLQMAWLVAFATDNLIIAHIKGADAVTTYAVPYRGFTAVGSIIALPLMALWPTYTEAAERRDVQWLRHAFHRSVSIMAVVSVAAAVLLALTARPLIGLWTHQTTHLPTLMIIGFSLWLPTYCIGNAIAVYLNALNVVRFQVISILLMTIANLGLSILLVSRLGPSGAVLASVISYVALTVIPAAVYLPRHRRQLAEQRPPSLATERQRSSSVSP